jgi:hypothetical protein
MWAEDTLWAGFSLCPHDSTLEPLYGFGWNLVWNLYHWRQP